MMKITKGEAYNALNGLSLLGSLKIPAIASFKVARCTRVIKDVSTDIEKVKNDILLNNAKKTKNGKPVLEKDKDGEEIEGHYIFEDSEKTAKEVKEFMETEVEVDINTGIKIESLGNVSLPPAAMESMLWLIEE